MPSSRKLALIGAFASLFGFAARAGAQQDTQGFAVERLYQAAPGGGWVVMDDLDIHGGLGGAVAVTSGYEHDPLRIKSSDGSQHLNVVSDFAFADFGFAGTYDRFRLYLNLDVPLAAGGSSGTVGAYRFAAPYVAVNSTPHAANLGNDPDTISDPRIGFDARIIGDVGGPFRLGAGAQLLVPSGDRSAYDTDGTFRAMGRVLFAGDVGILTYAAQLGVHIRPLDSETPGGPQGTEGLFGVAGGLRLGVDRTGRTAVVIGPEIYGESALRSFLSPAATGLEGLLSARVEGTDSDGPQVRVKLGVGAGINDHFGAPEWRLVFGIELFDHKDACPDTPGVKAQDPL
jgi:hypothetical protein